LNNASTYAYKLWKCGLTTASSPRKSEPTIDSQA